MSPSLTFANEAATSLYIMYATPDGHQHTWFWTGFMHFDLVRGFGPYTSTAKVVPKAPFGFT